MMDRQPTEIIKVCMQLGIFASLNQRLDAETIKIICEDFGFHFWGLNCVTDKGAYREYTPFGNLVGVSDRTFNLTVVGKDIPKLIVLKSDANDPLAK
jgi:hypothetical protein